MDNDPFRSSRRLQRTPTRVHAAAVPVPAAAVVKDDVDENIFVRPPIKPSSLLPPPPTAAIATAKAPLPSEVFRPSTALARSPVVHSKPTMPVVQPAPAQQKEQPQPLPSQDLLDLQVLKLQQQLDKQRELERQQRLEQQRLAQQRLEQQRLEQQRLEQLEKQQLEKRQREQEEERRKQQEQEQQEQERVRRLELEQQQQKEHEQEQQQEQEKQLNHDNDELRRHLEALAVTDPTNEVAKRRLERRIDMYLYRRDVLQQTEATLRALIAVSSNKK